jgi:copper homeostasis protein
MVNREILYVTFMSALILEIIVSTVDDAIEAARGGADRLEVVRDLDRAGLTPPIELVRQIAREVRLPLRVMARERDSFECSGDDERRALCEVARALDDLGVDGIIVGWLRNGSVDHETIARVLSAAPSLRATFHRAFDDLSDAAAGLTDLKRHVQIDRVLTGGGDGPWIERCARLETYARLAHPRLTVLPGGGVDGAGLQALAGCRLITEAHIGRAAREPAETWGKVSAELVRQLRRMGTNHNVGPRVVR